MSARNLSTAVWRKSSRSNGNGGANCVEVAVLEAEVAVRDSKDPHGPALVFAAIESAVRGPDLDCRFAAQVERLVALELHSKH
jgi:hypothetical protein